MSRNPSDQYEYWELLKKSFPKEFMEKVGEEDKKRRTPDLWDRLDGDIKKSLKDEDGITVSGEKTDDELIEFFTMGDYHLYMDMSIRSLDEILKIFIEFNFHDDDGDDVKYMKMYYAIDDDYSYEAALNGVLRVVDYFRERTRFNGGHMPSSLNTTLDEFIDEIYSHTWIDACNLVARNAVVSARHGYLHERWDANDERRKRYDSLSRPDSHLFSSDDGKAVVLMTFLDDSPCPDVSFDMYARRFDSDHDGWNVNHKVLPFINDQGFSFTTRVLLMLNDFLDSSGIKR